MSARALENEVNAYHHHVVNSREIQIMQQVATRPLSNQFFIEKHTMNDIHKTSGDNLQLSSKDKRMSEVYVSKNLQFNTFDQAEMGQNKIISQKTFNKENCQEDAILSARTETHNMNNMNPL